MSAIFSDEELTQLESLLGMKFIELYQKLWSDRCKVKVKEINHESPPEKPKLLSYPPYINRVSLPRTDEND